MRGGDHVRHFKQRGVTWSWLEHVKTARRYLRFLRARARAASTIATCRIDQVRVRLIRAIRASDLMDVFRLKRRMLTARNPALRSSMSGT